MNRILIICGSGMSSSIMARKVTEAFSKKGRNVKADFSDYRSALRKTPENNYDLYVISPQIRMYLPLFEQKIANPKKLMVIKAEDYVPLSEHVNHIVERINQQLY